MARLGLILSVNRILAAGADVNVVAREHDLTPLMVACSLGKAKGSRVALRLIEAGADVKYVRRSDGMTALKFAARSCTAEVLKRLIEHGAEVEGRKRDVQTALMLAAREGNVEALKVLIENGADLERKCGLKWAEGRTAEGLAELEGRRTAARFLERVRLSRRRRDAEWGRLGMGTSGIPHQRGEK
jgi:ankyrin repeat protein